MDSERWVLVSGFTQTHTAWRPVRVEGERLLRGAPRATSFVEAAHAARSAVSRSARSRSVDVEPTTYVGYSQGGRLCLQLALDRPDCGATPRARRARRRASPTPRHARHGSTPTSSSRRRSNTTASTRSSTAGSRNRCSRPCRASAAASRSAGRRTPSTGSRISCACSGRACSRRTGTGSPSSRCRCC